MSEYLVQRQSLENIANEIRVLSGTTEPLGLDEMATNVNDANDEVAAQATQIEEIMGLLDGKSVPGGGGGSSGGGIGTCTVRIEPYQWMGDERIKYVIATTVVNGVITPYYQMFNNDNTSLGYGTDEVVTISNVLCGSIIGLGVYLYSDLPYYTEVGGGVSYLSYDRMYTSSMNYSEEIDLAIYQAPTDNGANGTIGFSVEP